MDSVEGPQTCTCTRAKKRATGPGHPPQGQAVRRGTVPASRRPEYRRQAPGDVLLPPLQRATPARESAHYRRAGAETGLPRPHHPATRLEDEQLGEGWRGPEATPHRPCGTQCPAQQAHQRPGPPRLHNRARSGRVEDPDRLPQGQAAGREWGPCTTRLTRGEAAPS